MYRNGELPASPVWNPQRLCPYCNLTGVVRMHNAHDGIALEGSLYYDGTAWYTAGPEGVPLAW